MPSRPRAAALAAAAFLALAPASPVRAQTLPVAPLRFDLLRADQPDRDLANPDAVTGDASIVHGWPAGVAVNGIDLSGVARLSILTTQGSFLCSGALVAPRALLTAAHCVTDDLTGAVITPNGGVTARFYGPAGFVDVHSTYTSVLPTWLGASNPGSIEGDDIAVVHLQDAALPWMQQYDLFGGNPFFQPATLVGYGLYGNGTQGAVGLDGRRRWGTNRVDFVTSDGVLWTDFDDGTPDHDAWCWFDDHTPGSPLCDAGTGAFEAALGGGDSGGPLFIGGRIAGVNAFTTAFCDPNVTTDCVLASPPILDPGLIDSFGSLNGYAWAAFNADFINANLVPLPEPASAALVAGGGALLALAARRRRRR